MAIGIPKVTAFTTGGSGRPLHGRRAPNTKHTKQPAKDSQAPGGAAGFTGTFTSVTGIQTFQFQMQTRLGTYSGSRSLQCFLNSL